MINEPIEWIILVVVFATSWFPFYLNRYTMRFCGTVGEITFGALFGIAFLFFGLIPYAAFGGEKTKDLKIVQLAKVSGTEYISCRKGELVYRSSETNEVKPADGLLEIEETLLEQKGSLKIVKETIVHKYFGVYMITLSSLTYYFMIPEGTRGHC